MLINQACELKGQFNVGRSMVNVQDNCSNYPGCARVKLSGLLYLLSVN